MEHDWQREKEKNWPQEKKLIRTVIEHRKHKFAFLPIYILLLAYYEDITLLWNIDNFSFPQENVFYQAT